jgi:acyl-CoA thioesterase I
MKTASLRSASTRSSLCKLCLAAAVLFAGIAASDAAQISIVALGTSNTRGRGVPADQSYPAQLQALLRAKGIDARVLNMGVNGDSTAGMLARLNSVPGGTRLVLFEYSPVNELKHGVTNTDVNLAAIHARLAARNIKVIDMVGYMQGAHMGARGRGNPGSSNTVDTPAGPHLSGAVYAAIAAQILPQVEAALGR